MDRFYSRGFRAAGLALALVLVTAQAGAIAHSYEHDLGTPQDSTCALCLTANQLLSGTVDSGADAPVLYPGVHFGSQQMLPTEVVCRYSPRQRGPPTLP
jgi:hypothetical protein